MSKPLRKCTKCGIEANNKLELELFINNRGCKYKKQNICKNCKKQIDKEYSKTPRGRESHNVARRNWELNNSDKFKESVSKYRNTEQYREVCRKQAIKTRQKFPEKIRARVLARPVKRKKLCEFCESTENLEKHHTDYNKPKEIITLCRACHRSLHQRQDR